MKNFFIILNMLYLKFHGKKVLISHIVNNFAQNNVFMTIDIHNDQYF